MDHKITNTS